MTTASGVSAETFHMKDGSSFDGTIVSVKADDLDVSVSGKTLMIRKDSIGWIDYEPEWDGHKMRGGERILKAGLGGAFPLPAQGFNTIARPGAASELEALVQLDAHTGVGVRMDDSAFTVAYPNTGAANVKANVEVASLSLEGRWVALPKQRISPFLVGGLGVDIYAEKKQTTALNTGQLTEIDDNDSGLAADVGGGVQFLISRHYLADLAARWHYAAVDGDKFGFTGAQSITLLATLGWRF